MASIAFAIPLLPGQTDPWSAWCSQVLGPRAAEYRASRARLGITTERAFLQRTPLGDLSVIYLEMADPARAFAGLAGSHEPFDVWFREHAAQFWRVDLTQPDAAPTVEPVFDGLRN